ncbi:MAG: hypothetical protein EON54_05205 [Alcaligenaceae bacterium]|nr:MAG: hypothetical protein EON54_05205 [Alcaligenaceae bacterium]
MTSADLKSKYPYMFTGLNIGLDLYEGWMPILEQVCAEIDAILGERKQGFHFSQIKEKYGSARFYFDADTVEGDILQRIQTLLDRAESATETACMLCGRPASIEKYGRWFLCLCDVHASERRGEIK